MVRNPKILVIEKLKKDKLGKHRNIRKGVPTDLSNKCS